MTKFSNFFVQPTMPWGGVYPADKASQYLHHPLPHPRSNSLVVKFPWTCTHALSHTADMNRAACYGRAKTLRTAYLAAL